ncbi:hypothetical protein ACSVDE_17880 [Pseudalkalibacillus sp. Hm43]|uniref:hypothetical protein n=1 Tax=Pseudalkalibacillus sp. Hm43 TaxID=3450742 RepID=UPI003F43CCF6
MEEQLKDLNKTLNKMLSTEDRFTEKQRQHIRDKIAKKRSGKFSTLFSNWKPIVSTAVTLVLLFAVAQMLFDNISLNGVNHTSESADSAKESTESNYAMKDEAHSGMATGEGSDVAEGQLDKAAEENASPPLDPEPDAVVQEPVLPLDEKLIEVYEQLKASQNQKALEGLGVFEVMQIYFHTSEMEDYETQYMLLYQDPAGVMVSKKLYADERNKGPAVSRKNSKLFIEELKQVDRFEIIYLKHDTGNPRARVAWGPQGENRKSFQLIRDQQKDIWTVMMAPMQ